jgi:molybdopterin converting factor small subunit
LFFFSLHPSAFILYFMEVEVKLYAALRRYRPSGISGAPHHPFMFSLPDGATVAVLVAQLGIPEGMINAAAVNDEAVEALTLLHGGDKVGLFPPSAGGRQ